MTPGKDWSPATYLFVSPPPSVPPLGIQDEAQPTGEFNGMVAVRVQYEPEEEVRKLAGRISVRYVGFIIGVPGDCPRWPCANRATVAQVNVAARFCKTA